MKIKKILILFYIFVLLATSCYANEINLQTTEEFKENSNINVKITIDIGEIDENVYFLQGQLEYDTNIFDKVILEDIELLNGWHDLVFNSENGMFIIEGSDSNESNLQDIMNIKMKTKRKLTNNTTIIKLKNIKELGESQIENELEDFSLILSKPISNKILPFTGVNPIVTYVIIIIIIGTIIVLIINKRKYKIK